MTDPNDAVGRSATLHSGRITRREVVAASSVALAGCSTLSLSDDTRYERSDIDVGLGYTDVHQSDDIAVTFHWRWENGDGGSEPEDAFVITWNDDKWDLVGAGELLRPKHGFADGHESTGKTIRLDGTGHYESQAGARFRHEDAASELDTSYGGTVRLSPSGHSVSDTSWVITGRFAHVTGTNDDTEGEGWFGGLDVAWRKSLEFAEEE